MDADDIDETDLYLEQLKEVFDSCDSFDKGFLDRQGLLKLCEKLELDEQAEAIVDYLLENSEDDKVTFASFKENFVEILCQSTIERVSGQEEGDDSQNIEDSGEESDDESEEESDEDENNDDEIVEERIIDDTTDIGQNEATSDNQTEISIKKYGRRSKPLSREDFEGLDIGEHEDSTEKSVVVKGKPPIKPKKSKKRVVFIIKHIIKKHRPLLAKSLALEESKDHLNIAQAQKPLLTANLPLEGPENNIEIAQLQRHDEFVQGNQMIIKPVKVYSGFTTGRDVVNVRDDKKLSGNSSSQKDSIFIGQKSHLRSYKDNNKMKGQCKGKKCNFVFIKTMKCATETIVRILRKYSYDNNLNIMLPRGRRIYLAWPYLMDDSDYRFSDRPFNGLIDHSIYNKTIMNRYFPPQSTHYVTIIREPLKHFKSAFSYFRIESIAGIFAKQPLKEYLDNIEHYDSVYKSHEAAHYRYCIPDGFSVTKNFIAHCLGMPLGFPPGRHSIANDQTAIKQYINDLDKDFSLVMIVEYFHESLVLLKRLMQWQLKDMIYKFVNRGTYFFAFSDQHKTKHKQWTPIDYMLYDHFNKTLWRKIAEEGSDFHDELKQFSQIQQRVNHYCWGLEKNRQGDLLIELSPFNPSFRITRDDCDAMDISWLDKIKHKFDRDNKHVHDPRPPLTRKTC